jgi:hypothetical protein
VIRKSRETDSVTISEINSLEGGASLCYLDIMRVEK